MDFTLKNIIKVVDESKDLSKKEQIKIAYSMPIYACALFVLHLEKRHNIKISI